MSTNRPTAHTQSCRASALPPKEKSTRITGTRTREGSVRRTSLAAARTGSGGGRAARRRPAVVATGLRRVPARRGRRGFEGRNQSQGGRRCSPREKSKGGSPEMMNRSSLAATMEVVTALVKGQKGARVSAKGGARAQWRRKGRPVRIRPGGGRTRHGSRRWPARGDACGAQRGKTEREGRGG